MGRPSWANEAQWLWLTTQATEYMKIKGNKKETAKFWPAYLDGWQSQWPAPALSDRVRDGDDMISPAATTEGEQVTTGHAVGGAKGKKALTVATV